MVCELDENRILAEFILSTIMKFMLEHVTSHEQGNAEVSTILKIYTLHYIVILHGNASSIDFQTMFLCMTAAYA